MAGRPRARRDTDVTIALGTSPGKSIALLAAAAALVGVSLLLLFWRAAPPADADEPPAIAAAGATREPPAPPPDAAAPARAPELEAAREPAPEAELDAAGGAEGEAGNAPTLPSGIGLFPPPGTDPIKVGIVVPDDFELPEGYLRHYQVTDDGQELEPILMLHPDYELLDDAGNPVARPAYGVVPPELAPPGLPIEMLEVPPPLEETGR